MGPLTVVELNIFNWESTERYKRVQVLQIFWQFPKSNFDWAVFSYENFNGSPRLFLFGFKIK